MKNLCIAIDGPAASGKSTVGSKLADRLGFLFFDTGVMYRAVTWAALDRGIAIANEEAVSELAAMIKIEVTKPEIEDGRQYTVWVDHQDVTWQLRSNAVNGGVSPVSTYAGVRRALTEQQRRIADSGAIVMVGRDIGSVVVPNADVKVYLDATIEERARRRLVDMQARGQKADMDAVVENLCSRDRIDSTRKVAPLSIPVGATIIDSTELSIDQVVDKIVTLVATAQEKADC